MADQGFYNTGNTDLRYMEIGIALDRIDRHNPGYISFCIPVLTPTMEKETKVEKIVIQRSKSNIVTENAGAIDVSDIETANYVKIKIPKELVCLPNPVYDIDGEVTLTTNRTTDKEGVEPVEHQYNFRGQGTANMSGRVVEGIGGSINVSGELTGEGTNMTFGTNILGTIYTELNEINRYIDPPSRWLIAFVGGDVSMPRVVCRLPDEDEE